MSLVRFRHHAAQILPLHAVKDHTASSHAATGKLCFLRSGPDDNLSSVFRRPSSDLVEVNGIEPMTSCLQSRRSPN
jgi:hypothetical protein